jgi:hypothetical protein
MHTPTFNPEDCPPEEGWIPPCPQSGSGCHQWLFRATHTLYTAGWPAEDIESWVTRWMSRDPQPREVENTLSTIVAELDGGENTVRHAIPKPKLNEALLSYYSSLPRVTLDQIVAASPVNPETISIGNTLRAIYQQGEHTIIFNDDQSQGQLVWHHGVPDDVVDRLVARNERGSWMLMNPVDGNFKPIRRLGTRPNGKARCSRRSEENTTSFKYLLLESDNLPIDLWLTIISKLSPPIRSITLSGNESAHTLIQVNRNTKAEWLLEMKRFAELMVPLGACPGSLTAVRLTRLPGVTRADTGKPQKLLYLDPSPNPVFPEL